MPSFFGLSAMPTTLLNAVLSVSRDDSLAVRGPDRVAVISPMYNEEAGAGRALASLLTQQPEPDELAISINGSSDLTYEVVAATLTRFGFRRRTQEVAPGFAAGMERWSHPQRPLQVAVFVYRERTAKSEAVNNIVASSVLSAERLLIVDGDTVFAPGFIGALNDNFYRLRWERGTPVLEDYALQSGTVTSFVPPGASRLQRFISAGRSAEYAFASVLRRGQVRTFGRSGVWGSSRLYTVVGCGFAARRDVLPVPSDTQTEDHDLTLAAQTTSTCVERLDPAELDRRGFRIVEGGTERKFTESFDALDVIELRRGGQARFVGDALMATEDPAHVGGYMRQIERWNGGGIQNVLKRIWGEPSERRLTPNVRFTVLAAQLENLLGLLLLGLFPVLLALGFAGALGVGSVARNLALWCGIDVAATLAMTLAGFALQARDSGRGRLAAFGEALGRTARAWLPYLVLKIANPVSFVAAATRVVPAFVRERRARHRHATKTLGVAWERPTARAVDRRTVGTAASMGAALTAVFTSILMLAPSLSAEQMATARLLQTTARLELRDHDQLPLAFSGALGTATPTLRAVATPLTIAAVGPAIDAPALLRPSGPTTVVLRVPDATATVAWPEDPTPSDAVPSTAASSGAAIDPTLSDYCRPSFLDRSAASVHWLPGTAAAYRPLSHWQLLMLGRLAPIEPFVVQAATAYDVPAGLLLQVLVNESALDPLAVGKTGDKGLSQMTSDALTLLRGVSEDSSSSLFNPHLVAGAFNVFDPDFSVCAGAAKLRWAMSMPGAGNVAEAYALYINPIFGLSKRGGVAPALVPAVDAMRRLSTLVQVLGSAYAAYRQDPSSVALPERRLIEVSLDVGKQRIALADAYQRSRDLVAADGVEDAGVYDNALDRLFARRTALVPAGTRADASLP